MRRRWLVAVAGALWLVLLATHLLTATPPVRSGEDALAHLFALPSSWFSPVRDALMRVTAELPAPGGALLPGLTTGDTSRVSDSLDSAMKLASLSHLTAVSGANCQIVVTVVFFLLAWCGAPRWMRILGAFVALIAFVALVTPAASVSRAATMSLAVLAGLALGRLRGGISVLALSVIVLLIIEPRWCMDYGFALSVSATAGLLLLTEPIATSIARLPVLKSLSHNVLVVLSVPIAAAVACQPVLILLSPSLSTYGLLANVLTVPAAGVGTVSGLILCVLALVAPPVASVCSWIAWIPAEWIGRVAQSVASWPLARLPFVDAIPGFILAILLSAAVVSLVVVLPSRFSAHQKLVRNIAAVVVVAALGASAFAGVLGIRWQQVVIPQDWVIAACDVGQGDAFLLRVATPSAGYRVALIDTGRSPEKLRSCLDRTGVTQIDLLVLTHYDMDHVGGVDAVIGHVGVALVGTVSDLGGEHIVDRIRAGGASVTFARAGQTGGLGGSAQTDTAQVNNAWVWTVLWPDGTTPHMQEGNAGSVAMYWQLGSLSAVFLADLGADAQNIIRSRYHQLAHIDVLKVAHHGSADTSPELTSQLHPRIALIGVGADNGYGHPTRSALASLTSVGAIIARTDTQGMLFVSPAGVDIFTLSTER